MVIRIKGRDIVGRGRVLQSGRNALLAGRNFRLRRPRLRQVNFSPSPDLGMGASETTGRPICARHRGRRLAEASGDGLGVGCGGRVNALSQRIWDY